VSFVALLDANVLYPPYLRDLLLRFAQAGVFEPRWSAEILDEVARNIKKGRGEAEQQKVERMLSLMRRHFEDAEVTGYEALTPAMTNDEKDRHVLAAAIVGGSDVIVTSNLKHFPRAALEPYDMDVQGPDEFLCHQWEVGAGRPRAHRLHPQALDGPATPTPRHPGGDPGGAAVYYRAELQQRRASTYPALFRPAVNFERRAPAVTKGC
jgi:predicted nucleic acid-binding protein